MRYLIDQLRNPKKNVCDIYHYPICKSDVLDFNSPSTSHFTKCIFKTDSVFLKEDTQKCIKQYIPKGLYQPVHPQCSVLAGTSPRACTVQYKLLSICSENEQNTWSWISQPFADKLRQGLLSGCIRLGPM